MATENAEMTKRGEEGGVVGELRIMNSAAAGSAPRPTTGADLILPRREAVGVYRFTAWMARNTFSGVKGNSFKRAPVAL